MPSINFHSQLTTIERHILQEQAAFPDATGTLTALLYDIALAGKLIASHTTRAGLADILGGTGAENVQGEEVQKLDVYAHRTLYRLNDHTGRVAVMCSEEEEGLIPIPDKYTPGKYVLLFDPLDGSSNIDVNVSVGTIFTIFRRKTLSGPGTMEDVLRRGAEVVAAGYIVYGSSTMLVYSTGNGVHGFTLDPSIGEFLLSHPNIRLPKSPKYYSANLSYYRHWSDGVQRYSRWLRGEGEENVPQSLSLRYVGSMVADIHRNLMGGGVFYYPADHREPSKPHGKLRLLYEVIPISFLIEQAGGYASDGYGPIRDVQPTELHQRSPFFVGNTELVEKAEEFIARYDKGPA